MSTRQPIHFVQSQQVLMRQNEISSVLNDFMYRQSINCAVTALYCVAILVQQMQLCLFSVYSEFN